MTIKIWAFMKSRDLIIKQLDHELEGLRLMKVAKPKQGWIRTIRKALGMTGAQLAKKLGVNRSRVNRIEIDEQRGAITLRTLEETAAALNCNLVYVLMPRDSLRTIVFKQAEKKANDSLRRISHTMELEGQGVNEKAREELKKELLKSLLQGSYKYLWEDK